MSANANDGADNYVMANGFWNIGPGEIIRLKEILCVKRDGKGTYEVRFRGQGAPVMTVSAEAAMALHDALFSFEDDMDDEDEEE